MTGTVHTPGLSQRQQQKRGRFFCKDRRVQGIPWRFLDETPPRARDEKIQRAVSCFSRRAHTSINLFPFLRVSTHLGSGVFQELDL